MGCFARALYVLSTMNEQIELGYLLNGSNNGHDPYSARRSWGKRPAHGLQRKGQLVHQRLQPPPSPLAWVLPPHQDPEVRARRQDPQPSAVNSSRRRADRCGSATLVSRAGTGREHYAIASRQEITTPSSPTATALPTPSPSPSLWPRPQGSVLAGTRGIQIWRVSTAKVSIVSPYHSHRSPR
jgi:hypothetical protein